MSFKCLSGPIARPVLRYQYRGAETFGRRQPGIHSEPRRHAQRPDGWPFLAAAAAFRIRRATMAQGSKKKAAYANGNEFHPIRIHKNIAFGFDQLPTPGIAEVLFSAI